MNDISASRRHDDREGIERTEWIRQSWRGCSKFKMQAAYDKNQFCIRSRRMFLSR